MTETPSAYLTDWWRSGLPLQPVAPIGPATWAQAYDFSCAETALAHEAAMRGDTAGALLLNESAKEANTVAAMLFRCALRG